MCVQLWADGGVLRTNPGLGTWGVVTSSRSWTVCFYGHLGLVTSNVSELVAAIKALQFAYFLGHSSYVLHLDSKYVIGVITGSYEARANLKLVAVGKKLVSVVPVDIVWVPSKENLAHKYTQR